MPTSGISNDAANDRDFGKPSFESATVLVSKRNSTARAAEPDALDVNPP
jgi:hypothetical protein